MYMVRKTKIKRKRNVKKTRRKRIRGGVKTAAQVAAAARIANQKEQTEARQFAAGKAIAKQAAADHQAKQAEEQFAAHEQTVQAWNDEANRQQTNAMKLSGLKWNTQDAAESVNPDMAYRGWVDEDPFANHDIVGQTTAFLERASRPKTVEVKARNKKLNIILSSFSKASNILLEKRVANESNPRSEESKSVMSDVVPVTYVDDYKESVRQLIRTFISNITSKIYEDFAHTSDAPKPYLTKVEYIISYGNPDDETLSKIICGNYFEKVCSLYNIETDMSDVDDNMTLCLTVLRTPYTYEPPTDIKADIAATAYIDTIKKQIMDDEDDL